VIPDQRWDHIAILVGIVVVFPRVFLSKHDEIAAILFSVG
jgi:hypothetical protein